VVTSLVRTLNHYRQALLAHPEFRTKALAAENKETLKATAKAIQKPIKASSNKPSHPPFPKAPSLGIEEV